MTMNPFRRLSHASLVILVTLIAAGCAGPSKLAQRSEQNLAKGDIWKAWHQATRALDREPMNPRAKSAVAAAGQVIAEDWQRRIRALASVDSVQAAEQMLAFTDFRSSAARYTTIPVADTWAGEERALRRAGAHHFYTAGRRAASAARPKAAYQCFLDCERFIPGYRDVPRLAEAAFEKAVSRIAVLPFAVRSGEPGFGREVAEEWRGALAEGLSPPHARFTRLLGSEATDSRMTVSQLGQLTREEAIRLGRKSGAQRVVWGEIGPVSSETQLHYFRDVVSRRITQKGADGKSVTRWVDVPIEVVARVRDVSVDVSHEVIATDNGATLARQRTPRTTRARVVWTSYVPVGDPGHYALVSEAVRTSDPARAKDVETRWKAVCGESTTLQQVLAARRETRGEAGYDPGVLGRFAAGTAFVFLKELPPAKDLAAAIVRRGWQPLLDDLARLDRTDDADLGVAASDDSR